MTKSSFQRSQALRRLVDGKEVSILRTVFFRPSGAGRSLRELGFRPHELEGPQRPGRCAPIGRLVEPAGIEPATSSLQS